MVILDNLEKNMHFVGLGKCTRNKQNRKRKAGIGDVRWRKAGKEEKEPHSIGSYDGDWCDEGKKTQSQ